MPPDGADHFPRPPGDDEAAAYFINTSRAKLVDNQALADRLQQGKLAGAVLDVHEEEPAPMNYPFASLPNVLLTPHVAYNSKEAGVNMLRIAYVTFDASVTYS